MNFLRNLLNVIAVISLMAGATPLGAASAAIELIPDMPNLEVHDIPDLKIKDPVRDGDVSNPGICLQPECPFTRIFEPGDPMKFKEGSRLSLLNGELRLSARDWYNRLMAKKNWAVPVLEALSFSGRGNRVHMLTLDLIQVDLHQSRLTKSFSVFSSNGIKREAWREDEFFLVNFLFLKRASWKIGYGLRMPAGLTKEVYLEKELWADCHCGLTVERIKSGRDLALQNPAMNYSKFDASLGQIVSNGLDVSIKLHNEALTDNHTKYKNAESNGGFCGSLLDGERGKRALPITEELIRPTPGSRITIIASFVIFMRANYTSTLV